MDFYKNLLHGDFGYSLKNPGQSVQPGPELLGENVEEVFNAMTAGAVIQPSISCFDGADIEIIEKDAISRRDVTVQGI